LPNALCEAMLCGAVPVGADVGGVASAIGESGVVVAPGDAEALRAGIRRALAMPASVGDDARERIAHRYPTGRRAARLLAIVDELLAEGR
jgi:glycosyltransferase involved in cell wall biosynthesis